MNLPAANCKESTKLKKSAIKNNPDVKIVTILSNPEKNLASKAEECQRCAMKKVPQKDRTGNTKPGTYRPGNRCGYALQTG